MSIEPTCSRPLGCGRSERKPIINLSVALLGWESVHREHQGHIVFLVRAAFWLSVVILLIPTDEGPQARLSGAADVAVEQAATFCERNPNTCAAGAELWATYLKKAEFALGLATRLVYDWMTKSDAKPAAAFAIAPDQPPPPPAGSPARDQAPQARERSG